MPGQDVLSKIGDAVKAALPVFDRSAGKIFVTCGEGVVAYRVALKLVAAGYPTVRIGVKNATALDSLKQAGAEIVEFDWEKEETYTNALEGVKSVFLAMPHHVNWEHQFKTFLETSAKAGVKHYVKLSFTHALATEADTMTNFCTSTRKDDPLLKVPLVLMHRECDYKLMKQSHSVNYTILFASHFMSNPTVYQSDTIRKEQCFSGASGGHLVNYVSPNDVADVAVRALLCPVDHHRVGYNLTGPKPISDAFIADMLSLRMNKRITYVDQPIQKFADTADATDWGPAADVTLLEKAKRSGYEEELGFVSHDIDKVCGRPAESYEDYLAAQDVMTPQELAYLVPYTPASV